MLKSKQISKVLAQGMRQVDMGEKLTTKNAPLGLAMLSNEGLPLNLVSNDELFEGPYKEFSEDTFKIYSMMAMACLTQTAQGPEEGSEGSGGADMWTKVEIDPTFSVMIQKLNYTQSEDDVDRIFVVIFYDNELGDAIARLKLENVCATLAEGLKGYKRSLAIAE